ncbi:response regulator transcription factor [Caldibacillus thermoamylovorans]|uniref:response regulator transcription factor n=1 Tax=Bacillaceae TaxID=186817 RepID=UPI000D556306|nr:MULTISPECIES: response regulator transcription factor [Bacillaceae]MCB5936084.1 response regulator transcription factor [Bacillus sp. DFI.2.34]AWI13438.1 DNA-binding response regulator [Caldibacillus thermoamylovorans]MCB7077433.1 response regulator transcription factor [Caldibacillus thermoamylovorans]MDL0420264.1 response regulator transcription factor [Caldibacillus thermoamylovorans]MED3641923.1 response regulator transcription factor [Caldifermentibacillus hisashii]
MYKILIVEDDMVIAKTVKTHLESWGYEVEYIIDFQNVMSHFVSYDPQLVLLDISLPFVNGFTLCNEIRKLSKVPIIFISSASDNMNIVMAISMGGDDFIAKPFDLTILTSKVQALLRRTYDFTGQTNLLEHRGAIVNTNDATLTYNGQKIDLTKNDQKILHVLLENKGKTVSRDVLMTRLWETDSFIDDNTLTVNINRLRKKLEAIGLHDFIKTKKGLGYLVD